MDDLVSTIQANHMPQIICLVTQLIITVHTCINLQRNKEEFPVKQLSPLLSLTALLCFFLINCISFISKLIQTNNEYYKPNYQSQSNCGQCRLYNNPQMIVLAVIYNGLRQLPLIIFIIKTYRVCLCYKISFEKQLSDQMKWLFSSQRRLLYLSVLITLILMVVGYFVFDQGTQHYGHLVFEFFCPKQSSIYDWVLTTLRFCAMAYVYTISIYTYNELDFKRFLILIFILTNTEVLLRLILAIVHITQKTYHQFYYHSFVMNLFGTLIMLYYSTIKQQRNIPPMLPILQSFRTFLQSGLGFSVLTYFVEELDNEEQCKLQQQQQNMNNRNSNNSSTLRQRQMQSEKYKLIFQSFIILCQINIFASYNNYRIKQQHIPQLEQILGNTNISSLIDNSDYLVYKCHKKQISSLQLQQLQYRLEKYCERVIFNQWRQTESSKYLQGEFKNNGIIYLRMTDIGIKLK